MYPKSVTWNFWRNAVKDPISFSKFSLYENFDEDEHLQIFYKECSMCALAHLLSFMLKIITIQFTKIFLEKNNSSTRIMSMSEIGSDLTIIISFMTELSII